MRRIALLAMVVTLFGSERANASIGWDAMYDLDDDGRIGFGDLAHFVPSFLQDVDGSDDAAAADFDQSRRVDFADFALFVSNFGRYDDDGLGALVVASGVSAASTIFYTFDGTINEVFDDNLNAAGGGIDTLLGHFDPTFLNLLASDDNSSKFGNGWASGLNGLPLTPDGSLFIKVTGAENTLFSPDTNSHTEFGFYQIYVDFYDSGGEFLETVILGVESLQHDLDAFAIFGNPLRAGGTVDVHIDNLIGLGGNGIIPEPASLIVWSLLAAIGLLAHGRRQRCG